MKITVTGIGEVTLNEFEAMLCAWVNAGAPKPTLEGTNEEKAKIMKMVAERGDSQIRALAESYLIEL